MLVGNINSQGHCLRRRLYHPEVCFILFYPIELKDNTTEEEKQRYIDQYVEHEDIHLDPEKIERNPGMGVLAKLMLNSFWGKFRFTLSCNFKRKCFKILSFFVFR